MTIATLILALAVTTAADTTPGNGGGEPVLLDFHASWCGPCQEMRPVVAKLAGKQYPIRSIDIDRSPELAQKYQVTAVPTFIVVDARGEVLARTKGLIPAADLAALYNTAVRQAGGASGGAVETQATAEASDDQDEDEAPATEQAPAASNPPSAPAVNPKPWETVVRIKICLTSTEWAYGSGTIIFSDANESVILTCAHIFRDKNQQRTKVATFRTPIKIDLFDGKISNVRQPQLQCVEKDIPGEAIDYDFDNDVGLIRIRPGRRLPASRVVPEDWKPRRGMDMYAVGCSHGEDATPWSTQILEPTVKMTNVESKRPFYEMKCRFEPKQGRSGGGLYTRNGYVAGVCDFADPNDHVGLYATPKAIYGLLDRARLTSLYRTPAPGESERLIASKGKAGAGTRVRTQSPEAETLVAATQSTTIPSPDMLGIPTPQTRVASHSPNPWRASELDGTGRPSRPRRGDAAKESPRAAELAAVDPGATARGPIPSAAGIAADPGTEGAAADDAEGSPAPRPETGPRRPSALGKWHVVQPAPRTATANP